MKDLTEYRKARNMGQRALAELLGVKQSTICRIETGAARPSLDLAGRIERLTKGKIKASSWVSDPIEQHEAGAV